LALGSFMPAVRWDIVRAAWTKSNPSD
jgi:hypothetical protein